MSGYKPGYSEEHSPTYKQGRADGLRDTALMTSCPGNAPIGPDPDGGAMYQRGYERTFVEGFHIPCSGCKKAS